MGDVAMTVPVLRAFCQQYPDVKLTVLTRTFFKPLFKDLSNVNVLSADFKAKHKGIFGVYRLSKEIRDHNIDAIADLHNVLRTKLLKIVLLKIPFIQIDKGRKEKKELVTGKNFQQLKTTFQRYADVFEKLGFPVDLTEPKFPQRSELNGKITEIIGKDNLKWIGIAPFAAYESKMYPLESVKEVIHKLSKDFKIVLFGGGKSEIHKLKSLAENSDNVVNIAGALSFDEELEVISNLDMMLSMDSSNGHLAALFGVKVLTLWGVTHPYAGFAPFNQPIEYSLLADRDTYPEIPTSVYGNKYPEGYTNAMSTISPEIVISKVKEML